MNQPWDVLEACLRRSNPDVLADLNPPATDAEVEWLQERLGVSLPADFITCLKVHDGQKGRSDWLFGDWEFLPSRRIVDEWSVWKGLLDAGDFEDAQAQTEPGVKALWWAPEWIPFTANGYGDHHCLDLSPDVGGRVGQVITIWHDDDRRSKESSSFSEWFAAFVETRAGP
jgi:cell wall assembly regulator SMI1